MRRPRSSVPPVLAFYDEWYAADDAYLEALRAAGGGGRYNVPPVVAADPRVVAAQLRLDRAWNVWQAAMRLMGV